MTRRRFQGWAMPPDDHQPLSRADLPYLILMLPMAVLAVIGIGAVLVLVLTI